MNIILRLLILSCLFLSLLFTSCTKEDEKSEQIDSSSKAICGKALLPLDLEAFDAMQNDSAAIVDIKLENTCLIIELSYSGCSERVIDAMAFVDNAGFIPILETKIRNVNPLEECLAFFNHNDTFDLTSTDLDLFHGMSVVIHGWNESFILDLQE